MELYEFKFRENLPEGFIKNDRIPELGAIVRYLRRYENRPMPREEFELGLKGFAEYLEKEKVPMGADRHVRGGPFLRKYPDNSFGVLCLNDSISSECFFGKLEKAVIKARVTSAGPVL